MKIDLLTYYHKWYPFIRPFADGNYEGVDSGSKSDEGTYTFINFMPTPGNLNLMDMYQSDGSFQALLEYIVE